MTRKDVAELSRSGIPGPQGSTLGGREDIAPVGTDGTGVYQSGMTRESMAKLSRSGIPNLQGSIIGSREDIAPVRANGTGVY
jgi:hypothetical protein